MMLNSESWSSVWVSHFGVSTQVLRYCLLRAISSKLASEAEPPPEPGTLRRDVGIPRRMLFARHILYAQHIFANSINFHFCSDKVHIVVTIIIIIIFKSKFSVEAQP